MSTMASQITSISIVCSTVCSGTDHRKHQSSTSLAIVREIQRWPVNSLHIGPVTRKCFHLMMSSWNCAHFCSEWCIVGYGTGALWDLLDWSIDWPCTLLGAMNQPLASFMDFKVYSFKVQLISKISVCVCRGGVGVGGGGGGREWGRCWLLLCLHIWIPNFPIIFVWMGAGDV